MSSFFTRKFGLTLPLNRSEAKTLLIFGISPILLLSVPFPGNGRSPSDISETCSANGSQAGGGVRPVSFGAPQTLLWKHKGPVALE